MRRTICLDQILNLKMWRILAALLFILGLFTTFHLNVVVAQATTDPLVVIAVDMTNQRGLCTVTSNANINTSHASTQQSPCPAGTIMGTKQVPRTFAIAHKEPYVLVSSKKSLSSLSDMQRQQVEQLIRNKSTYLLSQVTQGTSTRPQTTSCGNNGSNTVSWSAYFQADSYIGLFSTEQFYVLPSPSCSKVTLDTASIDVSYTCCQSGFPFFWWRDLYAGSKFNVPNAPVLIANQHYSHSVNVVQPKGYYYETEIEASNSDYWCNIPIN